MFEKFIMVFDLDLWPLEVTWGKKNLTIPKPMLYTYSIWLPNNNFYWHFRSPDFEIFDFQTIQTRMMRKYLISCDLWRSPEIKYFLLIWKPIHGFLSNFHGYIFSFSILEWLSTWISTWNTFHIGSSWRPKTWIESLIGTMSLVDSRGGQCLYRPFLSVYSTRDYRSSLLLLLSLLLSFFFV